MARAGRRPGQTETREHILAAARSQFGSKGYDGATIRGIAAEAGVNPALVHHFFGTKNEVFVAALQLPVNPDVLVETILGGDRSEVGERILRLFLLLWETEGPRQSFFGLLRSVSTNEQAASMLRQFMERAVLAQVAAALDVPKLRLTGMASQVMGVALARYVVRVEPLASASHDEVVALVGPVIQHYVDGPA